MPVLYFAVRGEGLDRAQTALSAAFIPTSAAFPAYSVVDPSSEREVVRLTAIVKAKSQEAAQARVGEALPGGYELEPRDLTDEL
jgi:hypothetical protein